MGREVDDIWKEVGNELNPENTEIDDIPVENNQNSVNNTISIKESALNVVDMNQIFVKFRLIEENLRGLARDASFQADLKLAMVKAALELWAGNTSTEESSLDPADIVNDVGVQRTYPKIIGLGAACEDANFRLPLNLITQGKYQLDKESIIQYSYNLPFGAADEWVDNKAIIKKKIIGIRAINEQLKELVNDSQFQADLKLNPMVKVALNMWAGNTNIDDSSINQTDIVNDVGVQRTYPKLVTFGTICENAEIRLPLEQILTMKKELDQEIIVQLFGNDVAIEWLHIRKYMDPVVPHGDTGKWGPVLWDDIHVKATYPTQKTRNEIMTYANRLPCASCATHFRAMIISNPPPEAENELFQWTLDRHNDVNKRLYKKLATFDEAILRFLP